MPFSSRLIVSSRLTKWYQLWRLRSLLDVRQGAVKLIRLGTTYGGWTVPELEEPARRTAVCVGAGEDISFDIELNKKGFTVYTLDPTPRAKAHVELVLAALAAPQTAPGTNIYDLKGFDPLRFTFVNEGLWKENATMRFFAPKIAEHVSHSIVNLQHTTGGFEAKCVTLAAFCKQFKVHNIDILKLDIEGAEYEVLTNLIDSGIRPGVLCVEFDEGYNPLDLNFGTRIIEAVRALKTAGYNFLHLEGWNLLFVLRK